MDDSGLLTVTAELPSLKQTFSSSRFYVDQEGHRSFEGDAGQKLVETVIDEAEKETAEVVSAVGAGAKEQLDAIDRKLEEQRRKLSEASSSDERRSITETVRHTRQEIARLRFHPDHRGRYLEHKLDELITRLQQVCPARKANAPIGAVRPAVFGRYERATETDSYCF